MLLIQKVPQLLVQGLDGAVDKLHPAGHLAVGFPGGTGLLQLARGLGQLGALVCRALGLRGHGPRLDGGGVGLLQDHRLLGAQRRGRIPGRTGFGIGLIVRRGGQATGGGLVVHHHIQRHRRSDGAARYVRDQGDAVLVYREGAVVVVDRSEIMCGTAGLRLLHSSLANSGVLGRC